MGEVRKFLVNQKVKRALMMLVNQEVKKSLVNQKYKRKRKISLNWLKVAKKTCPEMVKMKLKIRMTQTNYILKRIFPKSIKDLKKKQICTLLLNQGQKNH